MVQLRKKEEPIVLIEKTHNESPRPPSVSRKGEIVIFKPNLRTKK